MRLRAVFVPLFVACTLCIPAVASQPEGLVGKLIANPAVISRDCIFGVPSFEWNEGIGPYHLDPTHTVSLDLALIPFRTGETYLALDEAEDATSFLTIRFSDGLVNGISYNRSGWNDVLVKLRPATQDYTITINGVTGGPFPYDSPCQATASCFSIQTLRVFALRSADDAVAWMDSLKIFDEGTAGRTTFYELDFDRCQRPPFVPWGGLLISEPPRGRGSVKLSSGG